MNYWHLRADLSQVFTEIEVIGPFWPELAYYQAGYVSPEWGSFSPENIKIRTLEPKRKLKSRDFLYSGIPPSCSMDSYDLFRNLLSDFVEVFPLKVDDVAFVTVRPRNFLDLMDLDRSSYRVLASGKPYNFKHIVLRSNPQEHMPIFGFSNPETAWAQIIVNDEFKSVYETHNLTGLKFLKSYPQES